MTDPGEHQTSELLTRARRALSPTAADAERVRRALDVALGAGAAASDGGRRRQRPARASAAPARPAASARWIPRLLAHALVAAVAGTSGYWIGRGSARHELHTPPPASSAPASPPASSSPPPSSPPSSPDSSSLASTPNPAPPRSRSHRPAAPAPSAAESLAEEVRALRSVERALRDQHPGLALALLARLDREVPDGKLAEEREATGSIARCATGAVPMGVDLAETFAERHPDSVYLARVRQACGSP